VDAGRVRRAFRQLAEGLSALHARGTLHRDIKPSNVIVTRSGRVVLLDFGLATEFEGPGELSIADGQIVGTIPYMSPEQAAGRPLTPASDWYSVGVMLYQVLTGVLPFLGNRLDVLAQKQAAEAVPPRRAAAGVPADLDALCVELLRRDPTHRPAGPQILARLGGATSGGDRPSIRPTPRRAFIGRRAQLAALAEAFAATQRRRTAVTAWVPRPFWRRQDGPGPAVPGGNWCSAESPSVVLAGRCSEQEAVAFRPWTPSSSLEPAPAPTSAW
jgi:serine/threonine protein kinase